MITTVTEKRLGSLAYNDDTVGTAAWRDAINATIDGNTTRTYPSGFYVGNAESLQMNDIRLIVGDELVGTNQRTNYAFGYDPNTVTTYGGATNLWGLTSIDPRALRGNDFGVALSVGTYNGSNVLQGRTNYLVITGFNLRIPRTAVVKGVSVEVYMTRDYAGPGIEYIYLYTVKITVNYEYEPVLIGTNKSNGYLHIEEQVEPQIPQEKSYQYVAYEDNEFRGQWRDVESTPSLKIAINQLPGELPVTLARNLDTKEVEYEEILLSGYGGGQVLVTTQSRETILSGQDESYGIGAGTDLEVDHTVRVKEYYGGYEPLLTHKGDVLLTSQGEPLVIANGYPRGRMYYQGYVSDYGLIYENDNQNTEVRLLHLSEEMNNEIYKTPDTLQYDNTNTLLNSMPFGGFPKFGDYESVGQTFTAGATYKLKRIVVRASGWRDNVITATVRSGSTIGSGTILGVGTGILTDLGLMSLSISFDESIQLTNGQQYNVVFESLYFRQTQSQSYPAFLYFGADNAGGQAFYLYAGAWTGTTGDFGLQLWQEGGLTRVNELSIDPSQIMRKVLDYGKTQGNIMTYDKSTIDSTFTIVSAPFNTNTEKEAADYVLKLTPSNWYYFVDPGQLLFHLHGQPTNVTQWFELGKDIIRLELHKNIENIVNEVLFSGGGDPALFIRYVDGPSRQQWRKGLRKLADNRVTDPVTGDIIAENEADQNSQPIWLGTVTVLRAEHPKFILPGQLGGFRNFGNMIDYLNVQIVDVEVTPDTFVVQLGTQVPKQSQRIEDIKRNLTRIELENNPNAPS